MGATDHVPLPDVGRSWWETSRMNPEELEDYDRAVEDARGRFPGLSILKGFESEYFPEMHGYLQEELLGRRRFDYLIAATHKVSFRSKWTGCDTPQKLAAYTDAVIASILSGLFSFIAHPDAFGAEYLGWDSQARSCSRAILEAAAEHRVPLEINGGGMRKGRIQTSSGRRWGYPLLPFWEMASGYGIEVISNSDAHRPEDVLSNIEDGYRIARRFGLKRADLRHLETGTRREENEESPQGSIRQKGEWTTLTGPPAGDPSDDQEVRDEAAREQSGGGDRRGSGHRQGHL